MRIACFELQDWEKDFLKKKFEDTVELSFHNETLNLDNVSDFKDADAAW